MVRDQIKNNTLPDFLKSHAVLDENNSNAKVLKKVLGIDVYRLNQLQLKFLEELRMIEIMKALKTFVIWLQEGMYDFSSFPVTLKEDLNDCHIQELNQATAVSEGKAYQFLLKIKRVNQVLAQCELSMRSMAAENKTSSSLKLFLMEKLKVEAVDFLPDVDVCHYVKLRLALRKIQVDLSKKHEADTADTYETWDDKISDEVLPSLLNINCTQTPDSAFSENVAHTNKGKGLIDLTGMLVGPDEQTVGTIMPGQ